MSSLRILMIDDDPAFLAIVGRRLGKYGYTVTMTEDPKDGIARAATEKPDAIILDLYMPRIDGYEAVKMLRAKNATRDIPIVVLSAAGDERFQRMSIEWGAGAFVEKRALDIPAEPKRPLDQRIISAIKDDLDLDKLVQAIEAVVADRKVVREG